MAKPATRKAPSDPNRTKLIRAIRAACARKGIDDEDRRAIMADIVPGKRSMSDMTPGQLGKLLDHLNRDWRGPNPDRAHIGKIRALWWSLYWTGQIHKPNDEALSSFVKRQTGIEHLRFLDHRKANSVIEALKSWLERAGVMWWSDDEVADSGFDRPKADRLAVLRQLAHLAQSVAMGDIMQWARVPLRTTVPPKPEDLNCRELDDVIRYVGKNYRLRAWRDGDIAAAEASEATERDAAAEAADAGQ